jgi:hypothetical protein
LRRNNRAFGSLPYPHRHRIEVLLHSVHSHNIMTIL